MLLGKAAEPVDEPLGGEVGRRADGEHAALLPLQQPFGADGDPVQCIADDGEVIAASLGEDQPLPLAMEELEPECVLERFDLMADRALRDVQLFGRAREALAPGRGFEGLQAIQRWETTCHGPIVMRKSNQEYKRSAISSNSIEPYPLCPS